MSRVLELRAEAFADDVDITDNMCDWDEPRLIRFFENGGEEVEVAATPALVEATRPLRVLSLHGGGSNKKVNVMQMARLKRVFGDMIELSYLEGTRVWKKEDLDANLVKMFGDGPYYGWYGVENDGGASTGPEYVKAMLDPSVTFTYFEYEEALDRLEAHISSTGPYDVLAGFSQGAIMITMLTARTLQRAAAGAGPPPSWRCNVLLSALPPRASPYAPIFPPGGTPMHAAPPITAHPAIACFGKKDMYFAYGQQGLRSIYSQLEWLEHAGGHETAKEPEVNDALARAIWRAAGFISPI